MFLWVLTLYKKNQCHENTFILTMFWFYVFDNHNLCTIGLIGRFNILSPLEYILKLCQLEGEQPIYPKIQMQKHAIC